VRLKGLAQGAGAGGAGDKSDPRLWTLLLWGMDRCEGGGGGGQGVVCCVRDTDWD
jgi:hypothetical protein